MKQIVTKDGNPIAIVDFDGVPLDGHHRLDAANEMGMALFFRGEDGVMTPVSFDQWDSRSVLVPADMVPENDDHASPGIGYR